MNGFKVTWYANGYIGSYRYLVVAETLDKAKDLIEEFVKDKKLHHSWEDAKKGMENHHSGYIAWKEMGPSDKPEGCYDLGFDAWNCGSDHLRD